MHTFTQADVGKEAVIRAMTQAEAHFPGGLRACRGTIYDVDEECQTVALFPNTESDYPADADFRFVALV